ncbi:MAG: bacteriohemerythrin [Proteobacteria bacterium]|nr:bacteriohemerythrin [Pseudomonadota bacterium]MBU1387484.1 bacteriohemerythrin [Pseudomonadota bacterium]MBU1541929.1 bacteriohemerythrin [Pseudomonadota bacterium]MBU2482404.1 bacteriohemerythrin [Pseudomonadota bacterium]
MAKIQWTEDFSVNNPEIDQQHQQWIEIYNLAHDRMMSDEPSAAKKNIGKNALTEMMDYGNLHFSFEEDFMEKIGYPDLQTHKQIHKDFSQKLNRIAAQMDRGEYMLNSEVIKLIENWLVQHILHEDRKYAQMG